MATRTLKLRGAAFSIHGSVDLTVTFNGNQVFNGTVAAVNTGTDVIGSFQELPERLSNENTVDLCSFETTTDVVGAIPLSISVTGGTLVFVNLVGNYTSYNPSLMPTDLSVGVDINNPSTYTVRTPAIYVDGVEQAITRANVDIPVDLNDPTTYIATAAFGPEVNFGDISVLSDSLTDKTNIKIDGVLYNTDYGLYGTVGYTGSWHFIINNGSTLECDYIVSPELIVQPL